MKKKTKEWEKVKTEEEKERTNERKEEKEEIEDRGAKDRKIEEEL